MSAPERFNTFGPDERACPICARDRSLMGLRQGDRPVLTCSGCGNQFRLLWADGNATPRNTLERVGEGAPALGYVAVQDRKR